MTTTLSLKSIGKLQKAKNHLVLPWINELKRLSTIVFKTSQIVQLTNLGELKFNCSTRTEYGRTLGYGGELLPLASFLFLLKPDDVVWDIGASVGLYTLHAAQKVKKVIAFEPDPETAKRLYENACRNDLQKKVDIKQFALGDSEKESNLCTDGLNGFAPSIGDLQRHSSLITVNMKTIDSIARDEESYPSVLKVDIEGAESLALKGGEQFLKSVNRPRIIFLEVHPEYLPAYGSSEMGLIKLICGFGYHIISTQKRQDQYHIIAYSNHS